MKGERGVSSDLHSPLSCLRDFRFRFGGVPPRFAVLARTIGPGSGTFHASFGKREEPSE